MKALTGLPAIVVLVVMRRHVHGELWQLWALLTLIYGILKILYLERSDRRKEIKARRNHLERRLLWLRRMERARKLAQDQKPGPEGQG